MGGEEGQNMFSHLTRTSSVSLRPAAQSVSSKVGLQLQIWAFKPSKVTAHLPRLDGWCKNMVGWYRLRLQVEECGGGCWLD